MDKQLLRDINEIQSVIDELNAQIEELKQKVSSKEAELEKKKSKALSMMQSEKLDEFHDMEGKLFATVIARSNIGYSSDSDVIEKLKASGYAKFIKVKESLDKNPLKKEIKSNKELEELLNPLIVKTTSSYVVVTTDENHEKMLEHINANKKGN